jgi:hypothetical protein
VSRPPAAPHGIAAAAAAATPTPTTAASPTVTPQLQGVFAGRTSGDEIAVAIAVNGDKVAAYLCDGHSVEAWLQGTTTGTSMTLTGRGGAGLTGSLSGGALFGSLNPAGRAGLPFSAAVSSPPAGVFQYRKEIGGLATRIGWARLPDGSQVGIQDNGATRTPAPWLDPATNTFTEDGVTSTASPIAGTDTVVGP